MSEYGNDLRKAYAMALEDTGGMSDEDWANRTRNSHMLNDFSQLNNIANDFIRFRYNPKYRGLSDKYRHAMINCLASQRGIKDSMLANKLSRLREFYDVYSGENTPEASEQDMFANKIGQLLGLKYPNGDCDEMVQRYIKKTYK